MGSPYKSRDRGGRYDIIEITARVERARKALGISAAQAAERCGFGARFAWYKKVALKESEFSIADLGRVAEAFGMPAPWPFVEFEDAAALELLRKAREAPPVTPPPKRGGKR
jgi:transcriptional regulator with XRE-family HTH domain